MLPMSEKRNNIFFRSDIFYQAVAGDMFRTEPVIAENRLTKITIGDNQKSLWPFLNKIQGLTGDKV